MLDSSAPLVSRRLVRSVYSGARSARHGTGGRETWARGHGGHSHHQQWPKRRDQNRSRAARAPTPPTKAGPPPPPPPPPPRASPPECPPRAYAVAKAGGRAPARTRRSPGRGRGPRLSAQWLALFYSPAGRCPPRSRAPIGQPSPSHAPSPSVPALAPFFFPRPPVRSPIRFHRRARDPRLFFIPGRRKGTHQHVTLLPATRGRTEIFRETDETRMDRAANNACMQPEQPKARYVTLRAPDVCRGVERQEHAKALHVRIARGWLLVRRGACLRRTWWWWSTSAAPTADRRRSSLSAADSHAVTLLACAGRGRGRHVWWTPFSTQILPIMSSATQKPLDP
jgi:hypothetical protein